MQLFALSHFVPSRCLLVFSDHRDQQARPYADIALHHQSDIRSTQFEILTTARSLTHDDHTVTR